MYEVRAMSILLAVLVVTALLIFGVACVIVAWCSTRTGKDADRVSDQRLRELHGERNWNPPVQ